MFYLGDSRRNRYGQREDKDPRPHDRPVKSIANKRKQIQQCEICRVTINLANQRQKFPRKVDDIKEKLMQDWINTIEKQYPNLRYQVYLKPPAHFNRVSHTKQSAGGTTVKVPLHATQLSDVREDESQQRIHNVLSRLLSDLKEPMFVIFELAFDNYLNNAGNQSRTQGEKKHKSSKSGRSVFTKGKSRSASTSRNGQDFDSHSCSICKPNGHSYMEVTDSQETASNPDLSVFVRPRDLEKAFQRGQFDILLIHPKRGLMIFKVKAVGDAFKLSPGLESISAQFDVINQKIGKVLTQLDKEEYVLKNLLLDLCGDLPVTKGLILPNLKRQTVHAALVQNAQLAEQFCRCLGTENLQGKLKDALDMCIFSDQLPPIGQSVEVNDDIINNLKSDWWLKLVHGASHTVLSEDLYKSIIARFCGPATVQYVSTAHKDRAEVSTLPQAVLETSCCYSDVVLSNDQLKVMDTNCPRVFLTGPPGTAKTLMLVLKGKELVRQGKKVFVISLWEGSKAVSHLIHKKISVDLFASGQKPGFIHGNESHFMDIITKLEYYSTEQKTGRHQGAVQISCTHNTRYHTHPLLQDFDNDHELPGSDAEEDGQMTDAFQTRKAFSRQSWISDSEDEVESLPILNPSEFPKLTWPWISSTQNEEKFSRHTQWSSDSRDEEPFPRDTFRSSGSQRGKTVRRQIGHYGFSPTDVNAQHSGTEITEVYQSPDRDNKIYLLIDEAPWFLGLFVNMVEEKFGKESVVIWAASSYPSWKPKSFNDVVLTQSLRCPPVVIREMMMGSAYTTFARHDYTSLDIPFLTGIHSPTDGPPVKRIYHDQHKEAKDIWECEECGQALATFLTVDLQIGICHAEGISQQPKSLHFSDVLISGYLPRLDGDVSQSGFLVGLQNNGVKIDIITKRDESGAERLAFPEEWDCVQVAEAKSVLGLERPVVVVMGTTDVRKTYPRHVDPWFDVMARCTSQLIIVEEPSIERWFRQRLSL